jgi:hypothetical protein
MNLAQLVGLAKLGKQVRHVVTDLRIAQSYVVRVVAFDQLEKKPLQWMGLRYHSRLLRKTRVPLGVAPTL